MATPSIFDVSTLFNTMANWNKSFEQKKTNSWSPKKVSVYPSANNQWSYTLLSVFLNELIDFEVVDHSFKVTNSQKSRKANFHFQSTINPNWKICISISNIITVKLSIDFLRNNWDIEYQQLASNIGSRNYIKSSYSIKNHARFTKKYEMSNSSIALLEQKSLLLYNKYDFSNIFNFFSIRIWSYGLPQNSDTEMITQYYQLFIQDNSVTYNSFESLNDIGVKGYLHLTLEPKLTERKLQIYSIKEEEFYINSGVFIMPKTHDLLTKYSDRIDGFLLDTTWKILPLYVTSIITATLFNSSIPLGFAFGHGETIKLYKYLLSTIEKKTNFNFRNKVILSDQGPSLKSLVKEYQMIHLFCYRHFLANIKNTNYAYEIRNLVRCTSLYDIQNSNQIYSEKFKEIIEKNPEELPKINLALKKIGLTFCGDQIVILKKDKWDKFSLYERIKYHMPSTTNSLEAVHGHMNKQVPRRNSFFHALFRVYKELNSKFSKINDRIKHNFSYSKRLTINKFKNTKVDDMKSMVLFFETSLDNCLCGQNKLESANYKIDIPCYHRISLGAQYPQCPRVVFELNDQFNELIIEHEEKENLVGKISSEKDEYNYIVRTIKYFSGFKELSEIQKFVDSHSNREKSQFYIQSQRVDIIQLIEDGIFYFRQLKNAN